MANELKWIAPTADAGNPIISNGTPGHGAGALSSEVVNGTGKRRFAAIRMNLDLAAGTPTGVISIFFLYELDGATFEIGGTGTLPTKQPEVVFAPNSSATAQIVSFVNIPIAPFDLKVLVWNATGFAADDLDIHIYTYDEELQ